MRPSTRCDDLINRYPRAAQRRRHGSDTPLTERGRGRGSGAPVEIHPLGIWTVDAGKVVAYRGYMDREEGLREANVCL